MEMLEILPMRSVDILLLLPCVQDMNENLEERINLQKAVFEIEDANLFNRYELKQLEDFLSAGQASHALPLCATPISTSCAAGFKGML